ncbi:nickel pincer cofactor biosynthesis protein LarC [Candidatus Bathyarchaeota archaeon]|nr:nickel pincer cofactor biosynthesis protein LarC [Candidatus Bathyarchaeota archaeon]MBS7613316.1 nickel pincer cofactor biosynthesis protein LarC [Candidatus Bathyarchaeota archaeon]MBS7617031.1 nickel pincer cofactor biosynthesis protein LarC [Candidatus Bathyarchaeota archaeon]
MRILYIDCSLAGISGDMMLSALLNLGAEIDLEKLSESIVESLDGVEQLEISYNICSKMGFQAGLLRVVFSDCKDCRRGIELKNGLEKTLERMSIGRKAREYAVKVLETLLNAESIIHGESVDEVHLHEIGSPDTLVDIVGTTLALENLGIFEGIKVYGSPVSVGFGLIKTEHGCLSIPAPVTLEILRSRGYPFKGGPVEGELATPTGVALLVNIVNEVAQIHPLINPIKVGYGAGFRELSGVPNILRLIYGEQQLRYIQEDVYVLETNIDDVQGEVLGHVIEKLVENGAKDACVIPITCKKSRPGYILKVISGCENLDDVVDIIFRETGTLGIRLMKTSRFIVPREFKMITVRIDGTDFPVKVKVAKDLEGRIVRVKPEYEELKKISSLTGIPIRELSSIIEEKAKAYLNTS